MIARIVLFIIGCFFGLVLSLAFSDKYDGVLPPKTGSAKSGFFGNKKWIFNHEPISILVNQEFPDFKSVSLFYEENRGIPEKGNFVVATIDKKNRDGGLKVSLDLPEYSFSFYQDGLRREFLLIDSGVNTYRDLNVDGIWDVMTSVKTDEVFILSESKRIKVKSLPLYSDGQYWVEAYTGRAMSFQQNTGYWIESRQGGKESVPTSQP